MASVWFGVATKLGINILVGASFMDRFVHSIFSAIKKHNQELDPCLIQPARAQERKVNELKRCE